MLCLMPMLYRISMVSYPLLIKVSVDCCSSWLIDLDGSVAPRMRDGPFGGPTGEPLRPFAGDIPRLARDARAGSVRPPRLLL